MFRENAATELVLPVGKWMWSADLKVVFTTALLRRLGSIFHKWPWLIRLGLNNRIINRQLVPIADADLASLPVDRDALALSSAQYRRVVACRCMQSYRSLKYFHSQPLEFLSSLALLPLQEGSCLLDAAGGTSAQYLRLASEFTGLPLKLWCQDRRPGQPGVDGITYMNGSVESIPLPDESLDAVTCHNSLQLFRGESDVAFLKEAIRVLRPKGRLVITPLLLANRYAEIWNRKPVESYDPEHAAVIFDSTATLAGWGEGEGFARVYDANTFRQRILSAIPAGCSPTIFDVLLDNQPVPDLGVNRHKPLVNGHMKAFMIEKD